MTEALPGNDQPSDPRAEGLAFLQRALVAFDSIPDSFAALHIQSAIDAIASRDAKVQAGFDSSNG